MILKSFGPNNTKHIDLIKKKKFKVVSSDEEIILAVDYEDKIDYRMNNENINKLDIFLAAGETSDFPILKEKFKSIIPNVLISGNMRMELLKKKYRNLLEKDTHVIKKKFGDYILLLTGFGQINKIRANFEIDWVYNRVVDYNIDPESHGIFLVNEQVKMQREVLLQTLKFINNFEKNFPNKNLVISPHPVEKIDFWKNLIKKRKFKKVFLNTDMHSPSYPLINGCEILISSNSTSLLEAHFLEKRAINLLGSKQRISEIDLTKKISKVTRSADELINVIKDKEINNNFEKIDQELKEIKNYDENFDSFEAILDRFDKLDDVETFDTLFRNNHFFLKSKFRMIKYYLKGYLSNIVKKNTIISRLHKEKVGTRLQKKNFIINLNHINTLEKVQNLKIKQIAKEVFLLDC